MSLLPPYSTIVWCSAAPPPALRPILPSPAIPGSRRAAQASCLRHLAFRLRYTGKGAANVHTAATSTNAHNHRTGCVSPASQQISQPASRASGQQAQTGQSSAMAESKSTTLTTSPSAELASPHRLRLCVRPRSDSPRKAMVPACGLPRPPP